MCNMVNAAEQPEAVSDILPYCSVQLSTSVYANVASITVGRESRERRRGLRLDSSGQKTQSRGRVPISSAKSYLAEGVGSC